MNPITDIVFSLTWILLFVWAVRSIVSTSRSQSVRNYNADTWTTEVTKRIHPEMIDVEPGEQLMKRQWQSITLRQLSLVWC